MRAYQNLEVTGSVNVTGSITANNMTAVYFYGTASQAETSSFLSGSGDLFGSLTGSMTGSMTGSFTGSVEGFISGTLVGVATGSFTGSFFGEFSGSGANLYDVSASSIVGLNLSLIGNGPVTASTSQDRGFVVISEVYGTSISGSVTITGSTAVSGTLDVSASAYITENLYVSGTVYGTSSYALSSSYLSGSSAEVEELVVWGTASIKYLDVYYETASYIYLTGSTKFGDETIDQHEFTGSVNLSGSFGVIGSASFSGGVTGSFSGSFTGSFTGSLQGTSSHANTASYLNNLTQNLQITGSVGVSGSLQVSGTFTVIGTDGSSLQINVPSDPTTGSLFAILDTSNNTVLEVFANRKTKITGSVEITGSLGVTGGISGSFSGSGANLFDISASSIIGLNLSRISTGSVTASVDVLHGFIVNSNATITGSLNVTEGNITGSFIGEATGSFTGSFSGILEGTASRAVTSSYAASAGAMDGGLY